MNEDISEAIFYNLKEWGKTDEEAYKMCHDEWVQTVYKRAVKKQKAR